MRNRILILSSLALVGFLLAGWGLLLPKRRSFYNDSLRHLASKNGVLDASSNQKTASSGYSLKEKASIIQEALANENLRSLDMCGKVIDQFGKPVVGAKVEGSILLNDGFEHSKGEMRLTETDAEGLFRFSGVHGVTLGINLEKVGYEYDRKLSSKGNGNYKGKIGGPDIFLIWKRKGAEPMVHRDIEAGLVCDGTPMLLDLLTGHRVREGGDLSVSLVRTPRKLKRGQTAFDWSVTVSGEAGGVVRIADAYPYEAPASGYESVKTIGGHSDPMQPIHSYGDAFYFQSRGGHVYGRIYISIQVGSHYDVVRMEMEVFANPSGSRNLEFDPYKQVKIP